MNALKSGGLGGPASKTKRSKKAVVQEPSDDESDTDGEAEDTSATDTDTDGE